MISQSIDPEVAAIATYVAGMDHDQVLALRDRIVAEIATVERNAAARERAFPVDGDKFDIRRDRAQCARRRREVDYLNQALAAPPTPPVQR
jgi:hypothetical protein